MRFQLQIACAALAAAVAIAAPTEATKARTLVKPSFYTTLRRYTLFSSASYAATISNSCPYPPFGSHIISTISINSTDTQAVIFRDDTAKEIIVAFPGTDSAQDFKTDENATLISYYSPGVFCPGCKVHAGYLTAWNSILPSIQSVLTPNLKKYSAYNVVVTGHSLGGALAAFAYNSLIGLKYPITFGYTYGQPRVGDAKTAGYINALSGGTTTKIGKFRRVTHSYDGVPNLPPLSLNYSHPYTEFFELDVYKSNNSIVPLAYDNDNISSIVTQAAKATYRCYGQDSLDCNTGYAKGFINQAHLFYTGVQMIGGPNGVACSK